MVILAAEDIGLADPRALSVAVAAQQAAHFIGMPEGFLPLTEAALYLAAAPKSNSVLRAYVAASAEWPRRSTSRCRCTCGMPSSGLGRAMGFGTGYRYAHDHDGGVVEQQHLPEALAGHRYYDPSTHGDEGRSLKGSRSNREQLSEREAGS